MLQFLPFFSKEGVMLSSSKHGEQASALYPSTGLRVKPTLMSLREGTTKQSHRVQYASEEIAALRSQ